MSSSAPSAAAARKARVYTRPEIEALIAEGRHIVILDGKVLKCDGWMKFHPGGDKSIKHMVGRDATDEVKALHSKIALIRMNAFQIGRIEGRWVNFVPPIQGGKFRTKAELDALKPETAYAEPEGDDSSQGSSADASPIFEPADRDTVRRRRTDGTFSRASSPTSVSSVELEEPQEKPKMSFLDIKTQQEISLDLDQYPPLKPEVQDEIVRKYRALNERIKAEGLYQCRYKSYLIEASRYSLFFSLFLYFLHAGWYCTSAVFLGCFWHQLVFTAHDAGHMGITHDYHTDSVIGIVIADFLGGLSLGWWKRNHNVHHIVTNHAEHDPDIQHLPFFAISHRFLGSLTSTYYDKVLQYDAAAKFFIKFQNFLYYPVLCFGRFNLYRLSWVYLLGGQAPRRGPAWWHMWLEIVGQIFFWYWFAYQTVYRSIPTGWDRFAFVMISHIVTMPVHVQITLSHFAMSTADLGTHESFPQKMLRTTMDVDCPEWLDFFHGGLQFQAIHHLYPRIPRHNLRRAQRLVMEFCDDVKIPYGLYGFAAGNKKVIGRLGDVARQATILAACQKSMVERGDYGLH
ncbi:putative fatty acid desaturase protein [Neofusicoccum parvum UCRNP2]|uniref:Delta 8-(E)-sphingolipid desaturase n=2 Tax=Neofusicoccum parvum TaxID=310453 RepID=R1GJP7_BOTPV|nr:putative fatty acid desaturase protein [Neofusicoccum parvum UCRNP2]GME27371.1 putative fatty acid desaturase [Neofusicoccum parvum]